MAYRVVPPGARARRVAPDRVMVATTVLVLVAISETVPEPLLATKTSAPSGVTTTLSGLVPTVMGLPTTVCVLLSTTFTVPALASVT